jgi:hypothetical protein
MPRCPSPITLALDFFAFPDFEQLGGGFGHRGGHRNPPRPSGRLELHPTRREAQPDGSVRQRTINERAFCGGHRLHQRPNRDFRSGVPAFAGALCEQRAVLIDQPHAKPDQRDRRKQQDSEQQKGQRT